MKSINKKADLSLTVIIVAAVALIVLIILIAIFSGRMGTWGKIFNKETEEGATKRCKLPGTDNECGQCPTGSGGIERLADDKWIDCNGAVCCFK